ETIILMITRMVPVFPYNLQNFAYGITDISFTKYSVLTFVFMFPGVSFFTIGAAGLTAGEDKWKHFVIAGILAADGYGAGLQMDILLAAGGGLFLGFADDNAGNIPAAFPGNIQHALAHAALS
ncbi:MAG: hypothetical protein IJ937_06065, partial [Treponema sp.]|nr:hypothetical protein [Treponema sp.]